MPRPRRPRLRAVPTALLAAGLVACDLPSSAPIFQQTWVVPGDSITVSVADFLPDGVSVTAGATPSFALDVPAASIGANLGQICGQPECQTPGTVTVPIPAFRSGDDLLETTVNFPDAVRSVTISAGALRLEIDNGLGFDPLRPNGAGNAPYGVIIVRIASGAGIARTDTIAGSATQGIPTGQVTVLELPLPTGTYASTLEAAVVFDVPAGQSATIDASNSLTLSVSVPSLTIPQAEVAVVAQSVETDPTEFDLADSDFGDEVESGGMLFTIVNPFSAAASLNVLLEAPAQNGHAAVSIARALQIPTQSTSTAEVLLSGSELRSLLGRSGVTIRATGTVTGTGTGNGVTIVPTARMTIRSQLRLTLNVGG